MSSKLLVNLIDPNSIVVPDTDGIPDAGTPDTGVLGIGEQLNNIFKDNTALFIVASLVILAVIIAITVLLIRQHKKQNLMRTFGSSYTPMKLNANRYLIPKLAGLSFIILVSVFGILKFNDNQRMANAETVKGSALTITTEEVTAIDIEMDDEAAFGIGESKVKITTATETGYTLMAYVDSTTTDLSNNSGDSIKMLDSVYSQALTDNTWGMALSKPSSQEDTIFRGLTTMEEDAMVVKVSGSSATEANDETTLYYAAYVTPELDYGTYEGVTINYIAVAHVTDNDITVNYHGNGYYFDEAGTKDINTVTYGQSCEMAYVGGNCSKIYTTEEPAEIVKTPNIRDDGTQNGPYESPEQVKVGMARIPGADSLRIELTYDLYDEVVIAQGDESLVEEPAVYMVFNGQGETTYMVEGDTASFGILETPFMPIGTHNYGFYAKVYPVYYQKPENLETVESAYCHFAKSNNLDDEGNMMGPYQWGYQTATLPGADRVKIEIEYALTDEASIMIFEGQINGGPDEPSPSYMISTWDEWSYTSSDISGRETFIVEGDTVTFNLNVYNTPIDGYDYGFYAKLYPVYSEASENTVPEMVCSNLSDGYMLPIREQDNDDRTEWYMVKEDNGYYDILYFDDERAVINYIYRNYDELVGKAIDFYAYNNYWIVYDANGGSGESESHDVLPYATYAIWPNWFFYLDEYHDFIGWNTSPDGSGTWYYPDDEILDLAQPGETIILYAQWGLLGELNSTSIEYYPNAYGVADTMGDQIVESYDESATLWTYNFKRPGYGFVGWSEKSDWVLGQNDADGNGTGANAGYRIYGPNQTIDLTDTYYNALNHSLSLYAIWAPSTGNLQNWTCPNNNTMPVGSVTALTDLRDNDTYAVAKLADGNCWMIENLRLDYDADFTPSLSQGFGGVFSGLAMPEFSSYYGTDSNSLYKSDGSGDVIGVNGAYLSDVGTENCPSCRMPRYRNDNTDAATSDMTNYDENIFGYGNYYNWPAAKASTVALRFEADSNAAHTSVCPAGWHLPTGNRSGEFGMLSASLGNYTGAKMAPNFTSFPNNFIYSGYSNDSSISWRGDSGLYWSSSSAWRESAYQLQFSLSSSWVGPGTESNEKWLARSVRCIAD